MFVVCGQKVSNHVSLALRDAPSAVGDEEERLVEVPPELASALESERRLDAAFQALSYTRRKEMAASVASAKSAETRARRLVAALEELRRRA